MNNLLLLGKSNASLSMILELLFVQQNKNWNISIIQNMEDTTKLEYNIPAFTVSEFRDTDFNQYNDPSYSYFLGAFRTAAKKKIYSYFQENYKINYNTCKFITLVSPDSYIASTVTLGDGCLVSHKCVIDSYAIINSFVTINRSSSIGHHTVIGEFTTINPNTHIAGNCKIGKNVQIGMSVTIIDGITIGDNAIIGANSFVNKNVPENVLVYGSPAKIIRTCI